MEVDFIRLQMTEFYRKKDGEPLEGHFEVGVPGSDLQGKEKAKAWDRSYSIRKAERKRA